MTINFLNFSRRTFGRTGVPCLLALGTLLGCGGGGSNSPAPPTPLAAADLPGAWINGTGSNAHFVLVLPQTVTGFTARALASDDMTQASATFTYTGNLLAGTLTAMTSANPAADPFPAGMTSATVDLTGTATANPGAMTLKVGTDSRLFSRDPLANSPVALGDLAGTYAALEGQCSEYKLFGLSIDPPVSGSANLWASLDPSGIQLRLTGTMAPVASAGNTFTVNLAGPNGSPSYTGLAYYRATTPPTVIFMLDDGAADRTQVNQASVILTRQ